MVSAITQGSSEAWADAWGSIHYWRIKSAICIDPASKGTFVRLLTPPAEARVVKNEEGIDVGDHVRVRPVATKHLAAVAAVVADQRPSSPRAAPSVARLCHPYQCEVRGGGSAGRRPGRARSSGRRGCLHPRVQTT